MAIETGSVFAPPMNRLWLPTADDLAGEQKTQPLALPAPSSDYPWRCSEA